MRFVALEQIGDGMALARNLPSDRADGAPLLRAGMTLTDQLASRLAAAGFTGVWVDDELSAEITPAPEFPVDVIGMALHAAAGALDAAPSALGTGRELDPRIVRKLHDAAADIADAVLEYPADQSPISDLPVATATAPWHAVRVALLGTFIGRRVLEQGGWLDYQGVKRFDSLDERLSTLALGLLVHDIGVPAPATRQDATGVCMTAEVDQPVAHVTVGTALFPAESTPAGMRVVIHGHHERWDGLGYPERKHRDAIALNARVAAVADAYDAMTATGEGRLPLSTSAALRQIEVGAGSWFDPALAKQLLALIPPHPVGHELILPDGRHAVVAALARGGRLAPTARLRSELGSIVELVANMALPGSSAAA
jgi:hypothetical protein